MQITRTSIISGITRTMNIDVTQDQIDRWNNREGYIQNIMPNISASEREFILSGISEEEWDSIFFDNSEEMYGSQDIEEPAF